MRLPALIAAILLSNSLHAGAGWGFQLGMGGSQFEGKPHSTQSSSTNLFSLFATQTVVTQQADLSGGLGLNLHADYAQILETQLELNWALQNAKTSEDLGSGVVRETQFSRESLESVWLLRLGWPLQVNPGLRVRPFASGGAFGNRTLHAKRTLALNGSTQSKEAEWDGVPNEDWGWVAGGGFDFQVEGKAPRIGLEFRYYEGQKDLDPKGSNEIKARSYMGILSFGF